MRLFSFSTKTQRQGCWDKKKLKLVASSVDGRKKSELVLMYYTDVRIIGYLLEVALEMYKYLLKGIYYFNCL